MKKAVVLALLAVLVVGCSQPKGDQASSIESSGAAGVPTEVQTDDAQGESAQVEKADSPEDVLRAFLTAMVSNDEARVRDVIVPTANEEILWQGEAPPPEALPSLQAQFAAMEFRKCAVGDVVDLPKGLKLEITSEMVNENRVMGFPVLGGEAMPAPLSLIRTDEGWKVDPGPIIAARLAAKRVRDRKAAE